MPDDKTFRMARLALADEAAGIENARRDLKLREERFAKTLAGLRAACAHPKAVEIRYEWEERIGGDCSKLRASGRRYCLACGLDESASTSSLGGARHHYRYRDLEKSEIVRREDCPELAAYTAFLAIFMGRLHELARFDEFDAKGVWRGEKKDDEHIRKGMD
ncbi:MAG TPA: hypothetical protein VL283_01830 [Candidatus Baltobacteraceae bacterium]|nr:hypothetical protein [Candidatus Baltobacteraceae bacterium]